MTTPAPTFGNRLRDLALALLNATLMLAVLLVFGVWLLLGRVQDFAAQTVGAAAGTLGQDMRDRLETQTARVSDSLAHLQTLEERVATATEALQAPRDTALDDQLTDRMSNLMRELQGLNATLGTGDSQGVAPETRTRLTALETNLATALRQMDQRVTGIDSQTAAELAGLRDDLQDLTRTLQETQTGLAALRHETSGSLRAALHQLFLDLAARMEPPSAPQATPEG